MWCLHTHTCTLIALCAPTVAHSISTCAWTLHMHSGMPISLSGLHKYICVSLSYSIWIEKSLTVNNKNSSWLVSNSNQPFPHMHHCCMLHKHGGSPPLGGLLCLQPYMPGHFNGFSVYMTTCTLLHWTCIFHEWKVDQGSLSYSGHYTSNYASMMTLFPPTFSVCSFCKSFFGACGEGARWGMGKIYKCVVIE